MLIGTYYKNKYIEELMNSVMPYFLEVNEIFERASIKHDSEGLEDEMMVRRYGKFFLFKKFTLRRGKAFFYFLGCKKESEFNRDIYNMCVSVVKEILSLN